MNPAREAQSPSLELIFESLHGFQRTGALKAALELDLFTGIAEGADTATMLARRSTASERGKRILCDYLSCGMTPTVSRISQRDEPPTQHHAQEEAFDSTEATWAHPRGDADLIQSTSLHNGVHQMMTRFGKGGRPCAATAVVQRDEAHDSCG